MKTLTSHGWQSGFRIDPIIDCSDFTDRYTNLFKIYFPIFQKNKSIQFLLVPSVCRTLFLKRSKNYTPKKNSLLVPFKNKEIQFLIKKNLNGNEKTPVSIYLRNTPVFKNYFPVIFSNQQSTEFFFLRTIRLHFLLIFSKLDILVRHLSSAGRAADL